MKQLALVLLLFLSQRGWGADLSYPELLVSPKASERLNLESKYEEKKRLVFNLPVQISGTTTLLAGLALWAGGSSRDKDPDNYAPRVGVAVGGAWLLVNTYLGMWYNPYTKAKEELASLPVSSLSQQLTRERLAEEAINAAGDLGAKLNRLAVFTNLATSIYMTVSSKPKSQGQVLSALAIAASLTPLFFDHPWDRVQKDQSSYKRRIYGPLSFSPAFFPQKGHSLAKGFILTYSL